MKAREAGLRVPDFIHVLNYDHLLEFMDRVPAPWVLKPRSMAGAIGIKKLGSTDEAWAAIESLGDMQSHYLLERFVPGDVFHVDTIVSEKQIAFAIASGYGRPPMEVSHEGGIFTTRILNRESGIARGLLELNERVITSFGLVRGASHSEFIQSRQDGELYFLETSARVGGAHIADLVEAATDVNLWAEWAKVEVGPHEPKPSYQEYAGLIISLARQEHPDVGIFADAEVVWRLDMPHHIGVIVRSESEARVQELLDNYVQVIRREFHAAMAPKDKPSS
jgi:biotin carboxylase